MKENFEGLDVAEKIWVREASRFECNKNGCDAQTAIAHITKRKL